MWTAEPSDQATDCELTARVTAFVREPPTARTVAAPAANKATLSSLSLPMKAMSQPRRRAGPWCCTGGTVSAGFLLTAIKVGRNPVLASRGVAVTVAPGDEQVVASVDHEALDPGGYGVYAKLQFGGRGGAVEIFESFEIAGE
jgi:hypothetical protein